MKRSQFRCPGAAHRRRGSRRSAFSAGTAVHAASLSDVTVAFLMPDQGSTRYEEHDHPGFVAEMKKLCPTCKVLYQNADGDASRQQQQFNSVDLAGRQGHRARSRRLDRRRLAGQAGAGPGHQGHRLRPADPLDPGRLSTSRSTTRRSARRSPSRWSITSRRQSVATADVGPARGQRLADRRGRRPDQEGRPRGPGRQRLPDARRIRHARMAALQGAAMGRRPDLALRARRSWAWSRPTTARAGGAIAAFKAAGRRPGPARHRQRRHHRRAAADHRGRPVQHHLEAERDRRGRGGGRRRRPAEGRERPRPTRPCSTRRRSSSCRRW